MPDLGHSGSVESAVDRVAAVILAFEPNGRRHLTNSPEIARALAREVVAEIAEYEFDMGLTALRRPRRPEHERAAIRAALEGGLGGICRQENG